MVKNIKRYKKELTESKSNKFIYFNQKLRTISVAEGLGSLKDDIQLNKEDVIEIVNLYNMNKGKM